MGRNKTSNLFSHNFIFFPLLCFRNGYNYVAPGSGSGRNREVHINFYCNPKVPIGEPAFTEQVDQKFFFDFQTSLACASSAVQCLLTVNRETYDLSPLGLTVGMKILHVTNGKVL